MVRAGRLAMAVIAVTLALVSFSAFVLVAAATTSRAATVDGATSCPAERPPATGELHLAGTASDQTYSGFALESKATLCVYAPPSILDVTVVGWNGTVTIPGLRQESIPPGVHYYVLLGADPDGDQLAFTEKVVGADLPLAAATPAPTVSAAEASTPLPTVTITAEQSEAGNASTPAVDSQSIVVKVGSKDADGNGDGDGDSDGRSLAKTGGWIAILAGRTGIALLLSGFLIVLVSRGRHRSPR